MIFHTATNLWQKSQWEPSVIFCRKHGMDWQCANCGFKFIIIANLYLIEQKNVSPLEMVYWMIIVYLFANFLASVLQSVWMNLKR